MAFWHYLNVVAYLFMVILNYLTIAIPIGGKLTSEISDKYRTLITPADFTFSIWALIYGLLAFYVFYALFATATGFGRTKALDKTAIPFFISCILNASWLIAWQYEKIGISILIMIGLLLTLIYLVSVAGITFLRKVSWNEWFIFLPFSIYLGWITAAATLNVSVYLIYSGFNGGNLVHIYAAAVLIVVAFLAIISVILKNNFFYSLTIAWALFGIYSNIQRTTTLTAQAKGILTSTSLGALLVALFFSIFAIIRYTFFVKGEPAKAV